MPAQSDALRKQLSRRNEINITVTGRKSGRAFSIPVWFIFEDDKLYLLPVEGSDTQWYKNVLKNPSIRIAAGAQRLRLNSCPSLTPRKCPLWSRNSAPSTVPAT